MSTEATPAPEIKAPEDEGERPREANAVQAWFARHPLAAYALRRIALYVVQLWGAVTVAFFFFRLIPGDPVQTLIQTLEQNYVYNTEASGAVIEHYRQEFGLDGNVFSQYVHYLYKVLFEHDMGPSLLNYPTPAQDVIFRALPWTLGLLGIAAVLAWIIGLVIGAFAGWRRGKVGADLLTNLSIVLAHVPFYFLALILVFLFANQLGWFPARSAYDSKLDPGLSMDFIGSVIWYGTLPALSIVIIGIFGWLLSTRMLMVPVLGEDYLTYAQAKGLKPRRILTRYALRNTYLPQITAFGIQLGFIFNGNVLVEQLFNYPGLGGTLVQAIRILDFNTILGITNLAIFGVLTANLVLDLLLPILDPRVKYWR